MEGAMRMTLDELRAYFDTLTLAEKSIGVNRKNIKHLIRLENLKQLLFSVMDAEVDKEFFKEFTIYEFDEWLAKNPDILMVYDREVGYKCRVPGRPYRVDKDIWGGDGVYRGPGVIGLAVATPGPEHSKPCEACI
jgi:CYTH domain-containing protein